MTIETGALWLLFRWLTGSHANETETARGTPTMPAKLLTMIRRVDSRRSARGRTSASFRFLVVSLSLFLFFSRLLPSFVCACRCAYVCVCVCVCVSAFFATFAKMDDGDDGDERATKKAEENKQTNKPKHRRGHQSNISPTRFPFSHWLICIIALHKPLCT